ncbi:hypothetical protein LCD39_08565 [Enterobacter asburiae]|uniref:hypothetical protein n=1 Tax=Enterobacter asburiae TaxID=61645 RepID=UPI001FF23C55|nr:hypothetical protein [Enterobacter asburiae]UOZ20035.1 hypothetical protein LCD39_08565 [Enterobacter asburiae]
MSNIDKQARDKLKSAAAKAVDNFDPNMFVETRDVLALLDELEESERLRLKFQDANCELRQKLEVAERTSAARLGAIDTTHKMFQRERDRAEKAEKRIAELSRHLQCAHAFIEHTEAFGHEATNGILCCGDAQWNIDESKSALAAAGEGE